METKKVTVEELEKDIEQMFELRAKHVEAAAMESEIKAALTEKQESVRAKLEALEMDSYKGKAGTFSFKMKEGFRVPKDLENKAKFFEYLKDKGIYEEMISVNSMTLNSWAEAECEAAAERGDFDFQLPGLEKAQARPSFRMTQSRGHK